MSDGIETIRNAGADDVSVRKTIETGDDDTATVTLEVTAECDEPLAVRLTEPALADVPDDDVDLRADHGPDPPRPEDGTVLEGGLEAGETCTVVYRVRNVDEDRFRRLDVDPGIETEADGPAPLEEVVDREGSEAVRRLVEGRADSLTDRGTDPGAGDTPGVGVQPAEGSGVSEAPRTAGADPVDGEPARAAEAVEDADADSAGTDAGGVAEALLDELRAGEVDDEVAGALREELRVGRSHDVRIKHLQRQVSDLAAYADILETFVDGHGTLGEAFDQLLADLQRVDGEVASLRDDLEELSETVSGEIDAVRTDVAALEDGRDDVRDRLGAAEDGLAGADARLEALESFTDRLSDVFESVDEDGGR